MVKRMRILDLFCGAGGAAMGYNRAGFDVVGVDINPQPNYPFEFIIGDAMELVSETSKAFDAIHASPPCQGYSTVTPNKHNHARVIDMVREALEATALPYVIENVEGAARNLRDPIRLCGSSFGLDLRRHRYFETNWPAVGAACDHTWQMPRFRSLELKRHRAGKLATTVGVHGKLNYAGERSIREAAMGIDWMSNRELVQAIPPAYTQFIGCQLIDLHQPLV